MKKFSKHQGLSSLFLVFIIGVLLSLIVAILQFDSLLSTKRNAQTQRSQQAFFAAEGALYETIQHLRNDPFWPESFPDQTEYIIGEAKVKRTITKEDNQLKIDLSANVKGAKRRLIAGFVYSSGERSPLDIVMIIDRSGSMNGSPLSYAQEAAKKFLDIIEFEAADDYVSLVSYSDYASLDQSLTNQYFKIKNAVNHLNAGGMTNIGDALNKAGKELLENGREDSIKVIVLLSDGVANRTNPAIFTCESCSTWPCLDPNEVFDPADETDQKMGSCCTHFAVSQAQETKEAGFTIFSILLNNITYSDCGSSPGDIISTENLGRLTLLRASNESADQPLPETGERYVFYKETKNESELENIYEEIAHAITSPEFFEYQEALPEAE